MKKMLALFILLALGATAQAQVVGPPQITCNQTFQVSQGAVALTKVISGVAGKQISLCGWSLNAGAATATASLSFGTGTNCGTGTTTIFPVTSLAINGVFVDHSAFAHISPPTANASAVPTDVCLVTTGTGPMAVVLYFSQN